MDIELVNRIKQIAIIALASDDDLIESIVLKGGNAIDLVFNQGSNKLSRTSYDLDFSIEEGDFKEEEELINARIKKTLEQTFFEYGYVVIDYKFISKPRMISKDLVDFWGGYKVTFKVVDKSKYSLHSNDFAKQRRNAIPLKPDHSPTFEIEFSKFEFVGQKIEVKLDGYTIYVYSGEMIVFEKLRAICQQLPEYSEIVKSHNSRARARDFYDIHLIMDIHEINPSTEENKMLIKNIFDAKKVPLEFIQKIRLNKSIHSDNWVSVKDTVSFSDELKDFDFYFNFVLERFEPLTFP